MRGAAEGLMAPDKRGGGRERAIIMRLVLVFSLNPITLAHLNVLLIQSSYLL